MDGQSKTFCSREMCWPLTWVGWYCSCWTSSRAAGDHPTVALPSCMGMVGVSNGFHDSVIAEVFKNTSKI